ncbi:dipeptidase [Zavarzinella formosa]|uniref:dipeptidase n=1 Tax=Zavarzinella formosa TaxID=360055 RepID=UPI0002E967ED|nr:membrane dipeptidase [Zavarzinella formosa]
MLIFDAHLDLAWNAIDWNRDLLLSVEEIRRLETSGRESDFKARGRGTVTFPELRKGGFGIFIATLLARLFRPDLKPPIQRFANMNSAYACAHGQMAYYIALEKAGHLRWIKDVAALDKHVEAWKTGVSSDPLGFILSMEGADPVLDPEQVHEWYANGLRIIGPSHYGVSPYAHGTGTVGGLFPPGKPLLREMEKAGMILDVTHLADQAMDEALDCYGGPVLASHHNCRALVDDQRQLPDRHIKQLISRGAVIGSALDAWMLAPGWVRGESTPQSANVTMATYVDHIDHVCQLAGNTNHAAIGTDLDGGFGTEQTPMDLNTISDVRKIGDILKSRGYTDTDVEKIFSGNWINFFRKAWSGKK